MRLRRSLLHLFRLADDFLFWPALGLVVWGELWARPVGWELQGHDKLLHFIAYFGLAGMAALGLKRRSTTVAAVVFLIVLGAILEVVQGQLGRDMSLGDALANTAGAIAGGVLGRVIVEPLRRRFAPDREH